MHAIQLELQDELAEKLASRERLLQVLAASGKIEMPRPYTGEKPYVRHTPVPITGKPVSELIVEQ